MRFSSAVFRNQKYLREVSRNQLKHKSKRRSLRRLIIESLEERRVLATVIVDTATDNNDAGVLVGTGYTLNWLSSNKGADGKISLREAILAANNTVGTDTISFSIGSTLSLFSDTLGSPTTGTGSTSTIYVGATGLGPLPTITSPISLSGYTQIGSSPNTSGTLSNAVIKVLLDGTSAGVGASGLTLGAGSNGSMIRGLSIGKFSGSGISISSNINVIAGNFIGLNDTGSGALTNGTGIAITGGTSNIIGGATVADRNVISGNTSAGILLQTAANTNTVSGNLIGLSASGATNFANGIGISIQNSNANTIGGNPTSISTNTTSNTISASINDGILVGGTSYNNAIKANSIYANTKLGINLAITGDPTTGITPNDGLTKTGTANLSIDKPVINSAIYSANRLSLAGYVGALSASPTFAAARIEFFINASGSTSGSGKTYLGFLTTDATGAFNASLDVTGISILATDSVTATTTDTTGNTSEFAVPLTISQPASFAVNPDSAIAVEAGGISNGTLGTDPSGNVLTNDIGVSNSIIGVKSGVAASASGGVGVAVSGNYGSITISAKGQYVYTVNNSNATVQGLKTSANTLVDVFTYTAQSTSLATASTQISITIQGANDTPTIAGNDPNGATKVISVYENTTSVSTIVASDVDTSTVLTYSISGGADASKFTISSSGVLTFNAAPDFEAPTDVGANNIYDLIVKVSDGGLSTSQTIAVTVMDVNDTLVVTTVADNNDSGITIGATYTTAWLNANKGADGCISLREAIIAANNTPGTDTISFSIPGTGVKTISVGSSSLGALPSFTGPVDLTGYTQIGAAVRTASAEAVIMIGIDGGKAGTSASGLVFATGSSGSIIRGLAIGNFGGSAISLSSTNNYVLGNYIGIDASGTTTKPNGTGIAINNVANNSIGGLSVSAKNIIANSNVDGVYVAGVSATGNAILGNGIFANARLGINLAATSDPVNGVTPNDGLKTSSQPNVLMDKPVLTAANLIGTSLNVAGWVGNAPNQSLFAGSRIEFFIHETGATQGSGKTYLGTLTSDASGNFNGTLSTQGIAIAASDKITATATDSLNNTSEFAATFDVNLPPAILSDDASAIEASGLNNTIPGMNATGNVLLNDTDPDTGDTLTVYGLSANAVASPAALTGNPVAGAYGSITLTPAGDFSYIIDNNNPVVNALRTAADVKLDTFTYSVRDSANVLSTGQIRITIQGADDTPTISVIPNQSILEDALLGPLAINITDPDTTLNTLSLMGTSSDTSMVNAAGFAFSGSAGVRNVTVTPILNANGSTKITLRVSDGSSFSESSFSLTIGAVNDAPVLNNASEMQLNPILQFDPSDVGTKIVDILNSAQAYPITDADANALQGIAIWNAPSVDGQWQYSIDDAVTWITVSQVSTTNALLLKLTDRVRYVPLIETNANYSMSFYAWDQSTTQTSGVKVDATARGGTTQFSIGSADAKINVLNLQSQYRDDGDVGFTSTSGWSNTTAGRLGDAKSAPASGADSATWTFAVPAGVYHIATTWVPSPDATTNAIFQIGTTAISVDQTVAPSDFYAAGANWRRLLTATTTGAPLVITLKGAAGAVGKLIADSIRIESSASLRAAESNDTLASASGLTLYPGLPVTISNYIGDGAQLTKDVDLYKVSLAANQRIVVDIDAMAREFSKDNNDFISRIRLFSESGTELASSAGSASSDPSLEFTAPSAGNFYIGISSAENSTYSPTSIASRTNNQRLGNYLLRVLTPIEPASTSFDRTFVVINSGEGTDVVNMSLRTAIAAANSAGGRTLVQFSSNTNAIELNDGVLDISSNITLRGPSTGSTVTIRPSATSVNGSLFQVNTTGSLRLENIILTNAFSTTNGASIKVDGKLVVDRSEIRNSRSIDGGALYISNTGSVQMLSSTIADSTANRGGAVYVQSGGTLTAINSTFSGNDATISGDAIANSGIVSLFSSTVARNGLASSNATEALQNGAGGRFMLHNSLIADNVSAADTSGSFTSYGYNLIGNAGSSYGLQSASVLHDQTGGQLGAAVIAGITGPLGLYGGSTRTITATPVSTAIDQGSSFGRGDIDQRGADRSLDGPDTGNLLDTQKQADIGATEFGTFFVNTTEDLLDINAPANDGIIDADTTAAGLQVSLRSAVREASGLAGWTGTLNTSVHNQMDSIIRFDPSISAVVLKRQGLSDNSSLTGDLDVWGNLRIVGSDLQTMITANWVTYSSGQGGSGPQYFTLGDRAFHVFPTANLSLDRMRLTGFRNALDFSADSGNGGAILNDGGTLDIKDSEIVFPYLHQSLYANQIAAENGGAIYSRNGTVSIHNSHLANNTAVSAGSIFVESGKLLIDQQTIIEDNFAKSRGGAIYAQSADIVIDGKSTLRRNLAMEFGGSLYIEPASTVAVRGESHVDSNTNRLSLSADGVAIYNMGDLTIEGSSTLSNHSLFGGSALYNSGNLKLDHVIIEGNGHTASASVLHNDAHGHVTFTHSLFQNNGSSIMDPGAIVNTNGWMMIDDVRFTNNAIASTESGLVANVGINATLSIHNSIFDHNVPSVEGGAPVVFNKSGNLSVDSSRFEYNGGRAGFYATSTAIRNLGLNEFIENCPMTLIGLTAQIEAGQTNIFVNDVSPFHNYSLPFELLIEKERVLVTGINDYHSSIQVERSASGMHRVTSSVRTFVNESQRYVLAGDASLYKKYDLPFDIVIDNEVMTVTAIDEVNNQLSVVRGRNGTAAAQHEYPFQVWAVSGGLKLTNSVIADNHAQGELWPSGSEMVFNWVHPHAAPTIFEGNTFFNNSRFPADIYSTDSQAKSNTAQIYDNSGDVRTFRGPFDVLPTFNRTVYPANASLSDPKWNDDAPSMLIENSVFASQHASQGKQPPAVRGDFQSAGGNFVDQAEVWQFALRTELMPNGSTIIIEQPPTLFPPVPFLAQIGHIENKVWKYEFVNVTKTTLINSGPHANGYQLDIDRGLNSTTPLAHPAIDSILSWSSNGFWSSTDRFGLPVFGSYRNEQVKITQAIAATDDTLQVDDGTHFPAVPFNARIIGNPTNALEYDADGYAEKLPNYEDITVTAVNGYQLAVNRKQNNSTSLSFNAGVFLQYFFAVDTALDAKLTRYTPVGETTSIVMPMIDSPLIDRAVSDGFTGQYANLSSNLGANSLAKPDSATSSLPLINFQKLGNVDIQITPIRASVVLNADLTASQTTIFFPSIPMPISAIVGGTLKIGNEELFVLSADAPNPLSQAYNLKVSRGYRDTLPSVATRNSSVEFRGFAFSAKPGFSTTQSFQYLRMGDTVLPIDQTSQLSSLTANGLSALDPVDNTRMWLPIDNRRFLNALSVNEKTIDLQQYAQKKAPLRATYGVDLRPAPGTNVVINLTSTRDLPVAPFQLQYGNERFWVTAVDAADNNITVTRAYQGTPPQFHPFHESPNLNDSNLGANNFSVSTVAVMSVGHTPFETTSTNFTFFDETTIELASVDCIPATPCVMKVGDEIMNVVSVDTVNKMVTVQRGIFKTAPMDFPKNSKVQFGKAISANATDTRFLVDNASSLPAAPFYLLRGMEIVRVDAVNVANNTIDVTRGMFNTNITQHPFNGKFSGGYDEVSHLQSNFQYEGDVDVQFSKVGFTGILAKDLTDKATTAYIKDLLVIPRSLLGTTMTIDQEQIRITGLSYPDANRSEYRLTIERGFNKTIATSHAKDANASMSGIVAVAPEGFNAANLDYLRIGEYLWETRKLGSLRTLAAAGFTPFDVSSNRVWLPIVDRMPEKSLHMTQEPFDFVSAVNSGGKYQGLYGHDVSTVSPASINLNVQHVANLPEVPFLIQFGNERMQVTSVDRSRQNITVTRAIQGTTRTSFGLAAKPVSGTFVTLTADSILPKNAPFVAQIGGETVQVQSVDPANRLLTIERAIRGDIPLTHHIGQPIVWGNDTVSPGYNGGTITLQVAIDASTTQATVVSEFLLPDRFLLQIHSEKIWAQVSARNADGSTQLSLARGAMSTSPQSHTDGSGALLLADAYGQTRQFNGGLDIGAFESSVIKVDSTLDLPDLIPGDGLVTTTAGRVTLRAAIMEANATPGFSIIQLPAGDFNIASELLVASTIEIVGNAPLATIVHADNSRLFQVNEQGKLRISNATLKGNASGAYGGAILVQSGTLVADRVWIKDSRNQFGAAIANLSGTVTIQSSTLSNNIASNAGGAIYSENGNITVQSSTISGNNATSNGGAIYFAGLSKTLKLVSNTIAKNSANFGPGIVSDSPDTQFGSNIVALNTTAANVEIDVLGTIQSLGNNLFGVGPIPSSALASALSGSASNTSLTVTANPNPTLATPFEIMIDQEIMRVTDVVANTWTVLRGINGSTIAAHASGAPIRTDQLWRTYDLVGSASAPINPMIDPLASTTTGGMPVHALQANSPAINASTSSALSNLLKARGTAASELFLDFQNPESLPPAPFMVMTDSQLRTVLKIDGNRALLNKPFLFLPTEFEVTVLADARSAPRIFSTSDRDAITNGFDTLTSGKLVLSGIDIGAYESVPILTLTANKTTSTESTTGVDYTTFTITRSGVTSAPLTVNYVVDGDGEHPVNGSDFVDGRLPVGAFNFAIGQTQASVVIGIKDDTTVEYLEKYVFRIVSPMTALIPTRQLTIDVTPDSDSAYFTIDTPTSIEEGAGARFDVTLHGSVEDGIWIGHSLSNATTNANDFESASDTNELTGGLYFTGRDNETRSFVILTKEDSATESNKSFNTVFTQFNAALASKINLPSSITTTLTDDDPAVPPTAQILVSSGSSFEFQSSTTFTVSLVGTISAAVTVSISTADLSAKSGVNYSQTEKTFTFTPGGAIAYSFAVPMIDQSGPGKDLAFSVNASITNSAGQRLAANGGIGTILESDKRPGPVKKVCIPESGNGRAHPYVYHSNMTITGFWPPVITPTSTQHSFDSNLFLSRYNYNINLKAGWTETLINVQPLRYFYTNNPSNPTDGDCCCDDEDDETVEPNKDLVLPTIESQWVVPYTDSITFNPLASLNYRNAEDDVLVAAGIRPGQSVDLKFGRLTVNTDNTLTYTPGPKASGLEKDTLLPELDPFGNVVRFANRETFDVHLVAKDPPPNALPREDASTPVELTIANNLPALIGTTSHQLGAAHTMKLPGIVFLDAQETNVDEVSYRIDLRDIFQDEGTDVDRLYISDILHGSERLNNSRPPKEGDPGFDDPHKKDIRVPVLQKGTGDSATFKNMIVSRLSPNTIGIYNEARITNIASGEWNAAGGDETFQIMVSDGTLERFIDKDADGKPFINWRAHEWPVELMVRANKTAVTNSYWRHQLGTAEKELRPWIKTIDAAFNGAGDAVDPAQNYSMKTFTTADQRYQTEKSIGGVNVDLFTGDLDYTHAMSLDLSGGNARMSLGGLTYDSSLIQDVGGPSPIIYATINGPVTKNVVAKLQWYKNLYDLPIVSSDVTILPSSGNQTLLAIRPPAMPEVSGVYGWRLDVTIATSNTDGTPGPDVHLTTSGELPVIVGDLDGTDPFANPFGAGWGLSDVPNYFFDNRGTAKPEDDRILIHFPGEEYKIFDATLLTANDWTYSGELPAVMAGASGFGTVLENSQRPPLEFGKLLADGNNITYRTSQGAEYVAKRNVVNNLTRLLIDRIEPPGASYDGTKWIGGRGMNFRWDVAGIHPVVSSVIASDKSETQFIYDAGLFIDKVIVKSGATEARKFDLTTAKIGKWTQLTSIEEINSTTLSNRPAPNGMELFEYDTLGILKSTDWVGDDAPKTTITYADASHMRSTIQVGSLNPFIIRPAGDIAATQSIQLANLKAEVMQTITSLEAYNPATPLVGTPSGGEDKTTYVFNGLGQMIRAYNEFAGNKLSESIVQYNLAGDVLSQKDWLPGTSTYRSDYYVHDYQIKPLLKSSLETVKNVVLQPYDLSDYRGNIVRIIATGGYTVLDYQNDNDNLDAIGVLLKEAENAIIDSDFQLPFGSPDQQIVTTQTWSVNRQLKTKTIQRKKGDPASEAWDYNDTGLLVSYTAPNHLTRTTTSFKEELPNEIIVGAERYVYQYDDRGYPKKIERFSVDNGVLISTQTQSFDQRGFLRDDKLVDTRGSILALSQFDYTPVGNQSTVADALGTRTVTTYNPNGLVDKSTTNTKGALGTTPTSLDYPNFFLGNAPTTIQKILSYTYYSDGRTKRVTDEVNSEIVNAYYFQPGAALFTGSGSDYFGTKSWTVTPNVAGVTDGTGVPLLNQFDVALTESDAIGRTHRTDNLLRGGLTKYEYADPRLDQPTTITQKQSSQGTGAPLVTQLRYDNRGNTLYEKSGELAAHETQYDELSFPKASSVLTALGGVIEFTTNPVGLVRRSKETRKNEAGTTTYIVSSEQYDEERRLIENKAPLDRVEKDTNPESIQYTVESGTGWMVATDTDRLGNITISKSDALGRVRETINAMGGVTQYEYDLLGNRTKETIGAGGPGAPEQVTNSFYDPFQRLRKQSNASATSYVDYFDEKAKTNAKWTTVSTSPTGVTSATRLDAIGNAVMVVSPAGTGTEAATTAAASTSFSYAWSAGTDSVVVETRQSVGLPASASNPASLDTAYAFGNRTRNTMSVTGAVLKTEIGHGPVLGTDYTVMESTIHDTVGRATSTTISGVENKTTYDDTVTGTGKPRNTQQSLRDSLFAAYDSAGNITKTINGSDTVRSVYDAMGRKITESIPIAPVDRDWKYEGLKTTYTNHNGWKTETVAIPAQGKATQTATKPDGTTVYSTVGIETYSNGASKSASNFVGDQLQAATNIEYNADGQVSKQTTQLGSLSDKIHVFAYNPGTYSTAGRTATRTVSVGTTSLLSTITQMDPLGRVDSVRETPNDTSGLKPKSVDFVYKGAFLDEVLRYNNSDLTGPSISNTKYQYDINRKIEFVGNYAAGGSQNVTTHGVSYDSFDRVSRIVNTAAGAPTDPRNIKRDDSGALAQVKNDKDEVLNNYVTNSNGELAEESSSFGRIRQDGNSRYEYDGEGNVVKQWRYNNKSANIKNIATSSPSVNGSGQTINYSNTVTVTQTPSQQTGGWYQIRISPIRVTSTTPITQGTLKVRLLESGGWGTTTQIRSETVNVSLANTGDNAYVVNTSYGWDQYLPRSPKEYYLEFTFVASGPSQRETSFDVNGTMTLALYSTYYEYVYDNNNRMISVSEFSIANEDNRGIYPGNRIATLFYSYDSYGNRIRSVAYNESNVKVEDRSFVYEDGKVLFEYDMNSRLERERFYAPGLNELLSVNDIDFADNSTTPNNPENIWVLHDHQGSVVGLYVSSDRNEKITYDAFGRSNKIGQFGEDLKLYDAVSAGYLGMDFDFQTLLYLDGGRYYDAAGGRYLTPGSMALGTIGIYAFANNTPVDRSNAVTATSSFNSSVASASSVYAAAFFEEASVSNQWNQGNYGKAILYGTGQLMAAVGTAGASGIVLGAMVGASATASLFGVAATATSSVISTALSTSGNASYGEYMIGIGISGLGGMAPAASVAGLGVGVVGAAVGYQYGNAAAGFQIGEMAGSVLVGGVADYRQAFRNFAVNGAKSATRSALGHAARYMAVEGGMTLAAGSIGYAATGTMDGALTAASVGNMVGSATARFTVACFAAGTPLVVDFEGNSRSIEDIEVGDDVLARSEFDAAGSLELKRVEEKFVRVAPVMELVVRGQVITTTAEHPFYVAGEGRFVPAGELTLEDQLVDSQGRPIAIDAIRLTDRLITVYNLRVADFHTYFVGGKLWQFDAWVHNANYTARAFAGERQARTLLEKRDYEILATLSNRNGNGLDIIARNKKGKLRFFEVKTTQSGDIGLSPAQSKGSQAYVWEQLQLAAGSVKHKQEWRWADGNLRGSHVRSYAKSLIKELDKAAGGKGLGRNAIQGAVIKFTNWSEAKNSGAISIHRW